jgi:outer membrane protein assembly factor BamB
MTRLVGLLFPVGLAVAVLIPAGLRPAPRPVAEVGAGCVMFGGGPDRNMVARSEISLSHDFPVSQEDQTVRVLGSRIKWKAQLGSRAYGGPIVAGGKVYVGTNNENPRNSRDRGQPTDDFPDGPPLDKGIIMCFDEKSGAFLWQMVHDKLESGIVNDWSHEGIASSPAVDGDRVYYVSNRCEVVCLDINGFLDGKNDGVQDEKYKQKTDGDVIWRLDMMKELKVFPHNLAACAPLLVGDWLFVVTANGVDEAHINIPSPEAPSFVCVDKRTGKPVWTSNLPGKNIMHSQWGHPAYGVFGGKPTVIFPGGDGWLYGLEPASGKLIWKFDANRKDASYELGGKGGKNDFICAPVVYKEKIYIGTGQDPEHGEGMGHFWCIDPAGKTADISRDIITDAGIRPNPNSGVVWHHGGEETRPFAKRDYVFSRTMSTACLIDDVVYMADLYGEVVALDAKTGKKYWQWDTKAQVWGSCYHADGKVLVTNEDGDLYIFKHDKKPQVFDEVGSGSAAAAEAEKRATAAGLDLADVRRAARLAQDEAIAKIRKQVKLRYLLQKVEIGSPIRSTPVVANGVLFVMTENTLYAVNPK